MSNSSVRLKPVKMAAGLLLATTMLATTAARSQVVTGTLGQPNATTTLEGTRIPVEPQKFGGVIKENAKDSTPWWAPRVVPPAKAPNIVLIMTDDQGYGVSGTFGGVVPTPALDKLAANGLRYTQMHSTALCSPTRAALITGRNHHTSGFGVISELSTGFPGYDSTMGPDDATIGRVLKDNGYATSWFGKNHNTPGYMYTASGPFDQWPSGMGFDYFYGFQGGETDQWTPYLFQNHTQIFPWVGKPDYNLITDMADEAISYLTSVRATAPKQPFFLYYVPGGTHSPHQPKAEWIAKFKGKFDGGWNRMREEIFANQKRLGVIPAGTQLTPWPDSLPKWETLTPEQKKLFARQAEVYAGYAAYTDYEIGRVIKQVEDMGEADNTIFIYIVGDNGTSPEGTLVGTPNQWTAYNGILDIPIEAQMKYYDAWGSADTYPHMAVAWSWAFDTPFKWTKQIASHFGGTQQGMVISWPGHIEDPGSVRGQFHHIIDIVPTLYEVTGIRAPEYVNGIKQKPVEGISMAYTFAKANANAPSQRKTQYFEMIANRGIYHDGWYAATTPPHGPWILNAPLPAPKDYKWELYNISEDFSQYNDLAAKMPDKLKELQAIFDAEAKKYNVLPLNNDTFARAVAPRPSATAGQTDFTYRGVVPGLDTANTPNIIGRSYTVTAEVTVPQGGGSGVVFTKGGRWGGFGMYLLNGKPVFNYNMLTLKQYQWAGPDALAPGKHSIVFDYVYAGPGIAKGGSGTLKVDGKTVATGKQENSIAFLEVSDETFDVGLDTRSSVNPADYKIPFAFNGSIDKLNFKLGPLQIVSPAEQAAMAKKVADARD